MGSKLATVAVIAMSLLVGAAYAAEQKKTAAAPKQIMLKQEDLLWKQGPAALPKSQVAILEGNPDKPGFFVMRLRLPAGSKIPAHYHENVERVTVLSGAIRIAMGTTPADPTVLPAGSYFAFAPKVVHNAWVDDDTILQIATKGPWTLKKVELEEKKGEPGKK